MKDLSVLLLRLAGHHCHLQTRYQTKYVCVLVFQLRRFGMKPKKSAFGVENFPGISVSPTQKVLFYFIEPKMAQWANKMPANLRYPGRESSKVQDLHHH